MQASGSNKEGCVVGGKKSGWKSDGLLCVPHSAVLVRHVPFRHSPTEMKVRGRPDYICQSFDNTN